MLRMVRICTVALLACALAAPWASANTTAQTLPFSQDWTNTALIAVDDDWSGVPGITGYRGDDAAQGTGVDPCFILADYSAPTDVNANRNDPNTFITGGVTEFDGIPDPTVALQGSGTSDNPNLVIYLNTAGFSSIVFGATLRDIDGSTDNAVSGIAVEYRIGNVGPWTLLSCVQDASSGPSLATLVTPVGVGLPAAADNQPLVEVRVSSSNAVGNDEWIGVDNIRVDGQPITTTVCQDSLEDWGDAPECFPAYPTGVIGHFPTCSAPCIPGTQELVPGCAVLSSPPGPTGFVRHVTFPPTPHFWLGCWPSALGPGGIDSEADGKTNLGGVGASFCLTGLGTDCVEPAFLPVMPFDQDECYADVVDHGVTGPPVVFTACSVSSIPFNLANCGPTVQGYLNILVDWNGDADWNDVLPCTDPGGVGGCAYEWAVKNVPIPIPGGCTPMASPPFLSGPKDGPTWFRITVSLEPVLDDFPWAGSATAAIPGGYLLGGETEDYPATIERPVPTQHDTWGKVKARYH